jgi:hypothetical protein
MYHWVQQPRTVMAFASRGRANGVAVSIHNRENLLLIVLHHSACYGDSVEIAAKVQKRIVKPCLFQEILLFLQQTRLQ